MKRLAVTGIVLIALLVGGAQAAGELTLTVVSQTNSTITLGWTPQPGYGYLFSVNGGLVSRTNDASRSSVKFSKVTNGVYEVAVIVKGATGVYPTAPPPPPKNQCEDAVDNDGDGKIDYPADPGCVDAADTDETDAPPPPPPPPPGGFPDASNTGVPAGTTLTAYTGPMVVRTDNTVIDGKTVTGTLVIEASGVVVKNTKVNGTIYLDDQAMYGKTDALIQDTDIDCGNSPGASGIAEAHFVAKRVDIRNCENGMSINQDAVVQDSFIHDLDMAVDAHSDGIQFSYGHWGGSAWADGSRDITIQHNTIFSVGPNGQGWGTSSIISNKLPDTNILIDNNLMAGGAYTLYCDQNSRGVNYRVTNNRFSTRYGPKVGFFGASTDCSDETQSGNVIYETGAPLTLQ